MRLCSTLLAAFSVFLLSGCDDPASPEATTTRPATPPAPAADSRAKEGPPLDALLQFKISGLESEKQAAWLRELFNRQPILRVEKVSPDEGLIEIRYSSDHTDRNKLIRMLEVNELTVEETRYLNPDPDRSG